MGAVFWDTVYIMKLEMRNAWQSLAYSPLGAAAGSTET